MTATKFGAKTVFGDASPGLNHTLDMLQADLGLRGALSGREIDSAARAAAQLNEMIADAIEQTGVGADDAFSAEDIKILNTALRADAEQAARFAQLADDFAEVVGEGGTTQFRGEELVDDVLTRLYQLGGELSGDAFNASADFSGVDVAEVADALGAVWAYRKATDSGLDRLTDAIVADAGLSEAVDEVELQEAAWNAAEMNRLIVSEVAKRDFLSDGEISAEEVVEINAALRDQSSIYWRFVDSYGGTWGEVDRGFHFAIDDGANTQIFGENLVDDVAADLYTIAFRINGDSLTDAQGEASISIEKAADWLTFYLGDHATTDTGLDWLVEAALSDNWLISQTSAEALNAAADAMDAMNHILADAIDVLGVAEDGEISAEDVAQLASYIQADATLSAAWAEAYGEDGFGLIKGAGGSEEFFGNQLIDGVADWTYRIGVETVDSQLNDIAAWLDQLYLNDLDATPYSQDDDDEEPADAPEDAPSEPVEDPVDNPVEEPVGKKLRGDEGADFFEGGEGDDRLLGRAGDDLISGGAGNDKIKGGGDDDTLFGGEGDDRLSGGEGEDQVDGGAGDDIVKGVDGDDVLLGGAGEDRLIGGDGNDTLQGGEGADVLIGGEGADVFVYANLSESAGEIDEIRGFMEDDAIDLSQLDANSAQVGAQGFNYVDAAEFSNTAGELRFANGLLEADVNGDGQADFAIRVYGQAELEADNLII